MDDNVSAYWTLVDTNKLRYTVVLSIYIPASVFNPGTPEAKARVSQFKASLDDTGNASFFLTLQH